jgi:hypothetical protein
MKYAKWSRWLIAAGLAVMIFGALDPLEGSIAILLGAVLVAVGAALVRSPYRTLPYWALGLLTLGVATLFGMSAVGGIGGTSGRSLWWGLTLLPYPVGWVLGLVGAARCLLAPRS